MELPDIVLSGADGGLEYPELDTPRRRLTRHEKSLRDIGGYRVTHTGYAQVVEIPPDAEFFTCFAEDGDTRIDLDRDACDTSSIFVAEDVPLCMYPIAPTQGISCWGADGDHASFRFYGYPLDVPE